jgi:hypothetical protein
MKPRNDQHTATIVEFTSLPTRRKRGRPSKASLAANAEPVRLTQQDTRPDASLRSRRAHAHRPVELDVGATFDGLVDEAIAAIETGPSNPDTVLGRYAPLASLLRSVSFHEGRLLERGVASVAALHPDLEVLGKPLKLPLVEAAMQAISTNSWDVLDGVCFDADARTEGTYRPDLVILNRRTRKALVIELKRSLATYGDSTRLAELKTRMMAAGLVLPDFVYKRHNRLSISSVDIAVIDGASRTSNHDKGIWKLSELDDLLDLPGAAAATEGLRSRFGERVRALIEHQAADALGLLKPTARSPPQAVPSSQRSGQRVSESRNTNTTRGARGQEPDIEGSPNDGAVPYPRILIGFARSACMSG